jgi:hypothetical protein
MPRSSSLQLISAPVDSVGCVAFQPLHSNLLSASGSRHFDGGVADGDSDSSDGENSIHQDLDSESQNMSPMSRRRPHPYIRDSSLKLWSFDPTRHRSDTSLD